jgi:hypothetical protein
VKSVGEVYTVSDTWTNRSSFVCATNKETRDTVCLTSYRTMHGSSDLLSSMTILEACQFMDGATGASNPVRKMWDQAQLVWGPEPLMGKVKCLVSIGTGVASLMPFKDDVLDSMGWYYRFNVVEEIGLGEAKKKVKAVAAWRDDVISSHSQMLACADRIQDREC